VQFKLRLIHWHIRFLSAALLRPEKVSQLCLILVGALSNTTAADSVFHRVQILPDSFFAVDSLSLLENFIFLQFDLQLQFFFAQKILQVCVLLVSLLDLLNQDFVELIRF
jgi:hypothetical protein